MRAGTGHFLVGEVLENRLRMDTVLKEEELVHFGHVAEVGLLEAVMHLSAVAGVNSAQTGVVVAAAAGVEKIRMRRVEELDRLVVANTGRLVVAEVLVAVPTDLSRVQLVEIIVPVH